MWRSKTENAPVARVRRRRSKSCRAMDSRLPSTTTIFSSRSLAAVRTRLVPQASGLRSHPLPHSRKPILAFTHACARAHARATQACAGPCLSSPRAYAYSYTLAHARMPTRARAEPRLPALSRSPSSLTRSCLPSHAASAAP
jgi:hypothetical protein